MPKTNTALGEALEEGRTTAGMSREDVARGAGVSLSTIVRIEREGVMPQADTLARIARVLKLDPKRLQGLLLR